VWVSKKCEQKGGDMFELCQVKETGLYTQGGSVSLQGIAISVEVTDVASLVTVIQQFKNDEELPIEATYCFPLEDGSAIYKFEVRIGDRLIKGEIEEREKAFEKYDKAMSDGHGAFLLDQEGTNIFVASVGNLMPGQEAVVSLSYVAELQMHDSEIRLMIPTTVSPRYFPAAFDPVKADVLSPPTSLDVPYGMSLHVRLNDRDKIAAVSSPSHRIVIETDDRSWNVKLTEAETRLNRDFLLDISLKEPTLPSARIQAHANGDRAVMLRLYPEIEPETEMSQSEVVFLLDCSGSMQGSSIKQASRALELCLKTLSAGDRFNIVRFGSTFEALFDQPQEFNEDSLRTAVAYMRKIRADLGGTEIYPALSHIFSSPPSNTRRRELIVLTDGEVGNVNEVINLARSHRSDTRIFSFGIGYGSSESLVRGLARATEGAAEFISPDERIEEKVLRQFSRLATPSMTNVRIDWKGMQIKQSPADIPPIFSGDSFTVYGLIEGGVPAGALTLTANIGARETSWSAPIQFENDGDAVATLWARSYIRELESDEGLDRGSRQTHRKEDQRKANIIETALRYNLMSSQTSMVAVDLRPNNEKASERAEYRRIPIQLTKDWHGVHSGDIYGPIQGLADVGLAANQPRLLRSQSIGSLQSLQGGGASYHEMPRPKLTRKKAETRWILDLLKTQTVAGSFESISYLPRLIPRSVTELKKLAERIDQVPIALQESVLATVVTLILLETGGQKSAKLWKRAAAKANEWLKKNATHAQLNGKPIHEALTELVKNPWELAAQQSQ